MGRLESLESTVLKHTPKGRMEIGIAVSHFSKRVFVHATFLVTFSGLMNMEIIKLISFDFIRMFPMFAIVAAKPKQLA